MIRSVIRTSNELSPILYVRNGGVFVTKKNPDYTISEDLMGLFNDNNKDYHDRHTSNLRERSIEMPALQALDIVIKQMETAGLRPRTITDYIIHVTNYVKSVEISDIQDVTYDSIYEWLSSMNVSNQTKLTRLKCLRAFLERCHTNGWLKVPFWRDINIKVSTPIKEGASDRDVMFVLSMLDLRDFVQLRDAASILLIHQTGIRVETAANLRESNIDLEAKELRLGGEIMKSHRALVLPIDEKLATLLGVLIKQNKTIRNRNNTTNDYVFITRRGNKCLQTPTNNQLSKRINKYRRDFGLKNFSPHALRRGFAKRLYDRSGNDIALVSKALGHSDLSVTTRYLHLSTEEVSDNVRKYL